IRFLLLRKTGVFGGHAYMKRNLRRLFSLLYFQVLLAIGVGVLIGHFFTAVAIQLKQLGDGFIKLIKMVIASLIFCSIVLGIAGMEDVKKIGKVGIKSMIYFQVTSVVAMLLGVMVINGIAPGEGMHVDPNTLDTAEVASFLEAGKKQVGF